MMNKDLVYDVGIVGGGLVGAMAAMMLQRRGFRTVVLESRPAGKEQKVMVGEALTEGTSVFLRHELGLTDWLKANAYRKFGFDFCCLPRTGAPAKTLEDCHELLLSLTPLEKVGPALQRLIPTYHVDRFPMNRHLVESARAAGATYLDSASVESVEIAPAVGGHRIHYTQGEREMRDVTCRWVLDCSGRRRVLGRQLGITHAVETLPTASVWNRFSDVNADPDVWRTFHGVDRRRHTIHMTGPGFWIWWIHQSPQQTSVGISYDKRQHQPDVKTEDLGFWEMMRKFPPIIPLLANAKPLEPYQYYAHLPYRADHWIDRRGYAIIGDAAWFTDALYSVGIETACRQLMSVLPLIASSVRTSDGGKKMETPPEVFETLNREFDSCARSVVKMNQFKYEHGWHQPHVLMQTAVYELGEIAELYTMQKPEQWTEKVRAKHYRHQWYSKARAMRLERFLEASLKDANRDLEPGAPLLKKALLPGPVIYRATWPLWNVPGMAKYFFDLIRAWGYSERYTQRSRLWPDGLGWMARRSLRSLVGLPPAVQPAAPMGPPAQVDVAARRSS